MLTNAESGGRRALVRRKEDEGGAESSTEDDGGSADESSSLPGRLVLGAAWRLPVILAAAYTPDGPDLDQDFDPDTGEVLPRR